ncbi:f-box domain protein [Phlyctema vagabunda]|uniref:F-box domain protein n=1 Tax=Phlyctema vagabunda TaxID=108571 RepID=A0ABR4PKQ3_9HELO
MDIICSITEVFEAVLLQLPPHDLLRVQRVCRRWNDLICQSPRLQQKLFFQPVSTKDYAPEFNPLLKSLFPPCFKLGEVPSYSGDQDRYSLCSDLQEHDWFRDIDRRAAVVRPEASWRRMFPVQPPAKIDHIEEATDCGCGAIIEKGPLASDLQYLHGVGAPMGLIMDIIVQDIDDWDGYFHIEWHMFATLNKDISTPDAEYYEQPSQAETLENKITLRFVHDTDCFERAPSKRALSNLDRLKMVDFKINRAKYFEDDRSWAL